MKKITELSPANRFWLAVLFVCYLWGWWIAYDSYTKDYDPPEILIMWAITCMGATAIALFFGLCWVFFVHIVGGLIVLIQKFNDYLNKRG